MTIPAGPPAWALIDPGGVLHWHSLTATLAVEREVGGKYAGALDRAQVWGPLRLLASDVALLFPEEFASNPVAGRMLTMLSGGRLIQPFHGTVAMAEYESDPQTGELLWPGPMSIQWAAAIIAAHRHAVSDSAGSGGVGSRSSGGTADCPPGV